MDALRVGRSIRAIRIRLGWRHADLAEASGVSRSAISRAERGGARRDIRRCVPHALGAFTSEVEELNLRLPAMVLRLEFNL